MKNLFIAIILTFSTIGTSCFAQTGDLPIKTQTFRVNGKTEYVNVMGDSRPVIPQFPILGKKAGYVRGYVKDVFGEPIAGAKLGLKSARMYDSYLANSTESDTKGFYEIKIPTGGAEFDYEGFTIKYSRGYAALGLHPADGSLSESYPISTGGVENFVMLPYGIGDEHGVSQNAKYRGNYYGGTLMLRYFIAPPGQDSNDFGKMLAPGSEIVIALKPISVISDGNKFAHAFVDRKKVEDSSLGEFSICNVPIGRYEITVLLANGTPLRLKQRNPDNSVFGIQSLETTESAQLIFNPLSAYAKTAIASRGNWADLEILAERS